MIEERKNDKINEENRLRNSLNPDPAMTKIDDELKRREELRLKRIYGADWKKYYNG